MFAFLKTHKVICRINWLFSSFTYLPNFIIWLPSFTCPWLVQLASKCHLAIFTFARFLDFFHSVKKVSLSKPSIFCKIICVSKRTLFNKDVVLHSFLQGKKFWNFPDTFVVIFSHVFLLVYKFTALNYSFRVAYHTIFVFIMRIWVNTYKTRKKENRKLGSEDVCLEENFQSRVLFLFFFFLFFFFREVGRGFIYIW